MRVIFQMAGGAEAPAEFTFYLPDRRVLCMAEVCTQTMHNALPPRGAQVRDTLLWARTIDEALQLFGAEAEVLINCHNWPVRGGEALRRYLEEQRDIYKYTHDQALRLANLGHTPTEIAAQIAEPDWLSSRVHARGYCGTLKFNARAVYQMYYGFYDGRPVSLDPLPPAEEGRRIAAALGGPEAALARALEAAAADDLQWAATLLSHVIFAGTAPAETDRAARRALAEVHRHQGFRAESGILRNCCLTAAQELEHGVTPLPMAGGRNADLAATLTLTDWCDAFALRLDAEAARGVELVLNLTVDGRPAAISIARQVEFAREGTHAPAPDAALSLTQAQLEALGAGTLSLDDALAGGATLSGDRDAVARWLALHPAFDLWFDVVTP
ncbi:alkyl sulfatase dimerization domain-containing protein [Rhodovulum sp. DZ06]|uniref:alkyl sulfatase dimerization domain-containing protein n=1 Tax=Rhodovulum sp. DZ06 TaxID=3425126 RepID=UPI003D32CDA9